MNHKSMLFCVLVSCRPLSGQDFAYDAYTVSVARIQGKVEASGITWQCLATRCTTRGPWRLPGVPGCSALALQVGAIRSYGSGATSMLSAPQLAECNSRIFGAPSASGASSGSPARVSPSAPPKSGTPMTTPLAPAPPGPAPPVPSDRMMFQEHGYGEFALHIQTLGIRFTGSYTGAYSDPPPTSFPIVDWVGETIRLPEFTVTMATSPVGTAPTIAPSGAAALPAPAAYVEIPVNFVDLPDRVLYVTVECRLSVSGPVPVAAMPAGGPWSEANEAGWAQTFDMIPVSRSLHRTLRVPAYLRPFMNPDDVRGIVCDTVFRAARAGGFGVDLIMAAPATDPASGSFLTWLRPRPSAPRVLRLEAEIRRRR